MPVSGYDGDSSGGTDWLKYILPGIGAAAGAANGLPQSGTQKTTTNASNSATSAGRTLNFNSTTPDLSPEAQNLLRALTEAHLGNLGGLDLSGFRREGISKINENSSIVDRLTQNVLASRGFSYSPLAALAPAQNQVGRLGQISTFENSLPVLQDQLIQQRLSNAGNFFSAIPHGQSSTGDQQTQNTADGTTYSNTNVETKQNGSKLGAVLGGAVGLGGTLAKLFL